MADTIIQRTLLPAMSKNRKRRLAMRLRAKGWSEERIKERVWTYTNAPLKTKKGIIQ